MYPSVSYFGSCPFEVKILSKFVHRKRDVIKATLVYIE